MLLLEHVTKKYGKTAACNDVSFCLENGSMTVLLGPNGAGKSTLIKSIMGFLRYQGRITVDGLDTKTPASHRILGYVSEMPALYPNLTVEEHLEFIARAYRLTGYQPYMEELLERFELTDKRKKFGDELSKGMQQKVNLCIGLLPRPQILLLDEPMIGLDPHAIKELKRMMEEMRDAGCTVFVSTHMIDSISELWDRTLIMKQGVILADVRRKELASTGESLEDLFFRITEQPAESLAAQMPPEETAR